MPKAQMRDSRNRGQIIPRGERKWLLRVYLGREGGKRKYSARTVEGTYKQAEMELTKTLREMDTKTFVEPSKISLTEFFDQWLESKVDISPRTKSFYESRLDLVWRPKLGHVRLDQLVPHQIQTTLNDLTKLGKLPRTVESFFMTLNQALGWAVEMGMLMKNPAQKVTLPRKTRREMKVLTQEQVQLFLERAEGEKMYPLWLLLLTTGMRPGEALALQWPDVNFENASVSVNKCLTTDGHGHWTVSHELKTESSVRSVSLPKTTVEALRTHKARQAAEILVSGPEYKRQDFVFASRNGTFLQPTDVRGKWEKALERHKMPKVRLYDARHTHITHLLEAGVHPKVAADRAGHSDTRMTMNTYSHVLPQMRQETAGVVEAMLFTPKAAKG